MMHANMTELLAAREGELGLASAHILSCQQCQQELAQLNVISEELNQLPEKDIPEKAWQNILLAYKKSPTQQSLQKTASLTRAIYALAASVLVVGFTLVINSSQPHESPLNNPLLNNTLVGNTLVSSALPELQAESRALEYTLANYQLNQEHLSAAQQFKIERLQWQLMLLDRKLMVSQQQQNIELLETLWADRIKNLNELHVTYNSEQVMRVSQRQRGSL